ncbi:MAG TPA: type II secretion system F family protein [Gemmataceae bacterium]|nr:type II secretion system F family protein [Gemmataceae bacterium]
MEYFLLALVFVFCTGVIVMVYVALSRGRQRVEARLVPAPSSDPSIGTSTPELVLGELTPALSGQIPLSEAGRSELQRDLMAAGMYRPTALMEYTAVRAVLTIAPLIIGGVVALVWTETLSEALRVWIGALIVAGLGFSIPRLFLTLKGIARKRAIERGLPTAIDMITLCLSAGLNVLNSLERVADELSLAYPELGFELQLVRRQSDLRSLEFALVQFAERVDLPQLRNISVILSQSEKLGTDGVSVLREYADNMRIYMKQHAEAVANRAPLKMLIPGYMMTLGFFILLLTPPAMEVASFRKDNVVGNLREEEKQAMEELNRGKAGALPKSAPAEEQ